MNANMTPGARIPRNAIRMWQSNETIATLSGPELTKSLRACLPSGRLDHVHPKDWPARCGYEALRETAEDLLRSGLPHAAVWGKARAAACSCSRGGSAAFCECRG